jgi:hypothetical protein
VKERALAKPATTAELNEIIKYIDNAKGEKSLQWTRRIKVSRIERLSIHMRTQFDGSEFLFHSTRKYNDKWSIFSMNISFLMMIFN